MGSRRRPTETELVAGWFYAWLGTAAAGGLFGAVTEQVVGFVAGLFIAAFYAVPVVLSAAVLTWACWLTRYFVFTAAVAGACTGLLATAMIWDPIFSTSYTLSLTLAALIGAATSAMVTGYYWSQLNQQLASDEDGTTGWQYSLRDLFVRFSVVSALIAGWSIVITHLFKNAANS